MTAWKIAVVRAAILVAAVFVLAYLCLFFVIKSARFQHWVQTEIAHRTGYELSVGGLSLLPPLRLAATAMKVSKSSEMVLEADRVVLTVSPLDFFLLSIHRLRLQKPILYLELKELFDSPDQTSVRPSIRHLNIENGTVVLNTGATDNFELRAVNVDARNLNSGQSTGINLRANVPSLEGAAEISIRGHDGEVTAAIRIQQDTERGLSGLLTAKNRPVAPLEAEFRLRNHENQFVEVTGFGKVNGLTIGGEKISGNFDSELRLVHGLSEANVSANIALTDFPLRLDVLPFSLPRGTATANVEGTYSIGQKAFDVKSLQLTSPLGNAQGNGRITFAPQAGFSPMQLRLRNIPLENLKSFLPKPADHWSYTGLVDADLELKGPWRSFAVKGISRAGGLQVVGEQFSLADLSLRAPVEWAERSLRVNGGLLRGKKFALDKAGHTRISADEIRFDGGFEKNEDQPFRALGKLRILRGRFATPDGGKVGENFTVNGHLDAGLDHKRGAVSLNGSLFIEQGELLWGTFFTDLKAQKPSLDFDGDYNVKDDAVRLRRFTLALAPIGSIDVTGSIEQLSKAPLLNLNAKSAGVQTGPMFDAFIRETFDRSYPFLNKLVIAGRLGISVRARGSAENLSAEGSVDLRGADIREKSGKWQVGPIELALPFTVHRGHGITPAISADPPIGDLTIASGRIASEPIGAIRTRVSLWNNRLDFHQPITIPIFGGTIGVSNLTWKDVITAPRAVSLSIHAKTLQLQRLTESLGWYRFGGTLDGSIPQVEWTENSLRSQGEIRINVFGGRVRIGKMEIENPFSSIPSIKLDASFQNIHLDQASETFAFGRISGILEGTVSDLVITDGQPSQFRADLHTVDKQGSDQWISVEALNKITVLSSGNDASPLFTGIGGLFENFRYSKLGFKATLRNDKLTLRGIESKDGKEYLVVGGWLPPTVNIISHTQEIGFSELLRRLERISQSEKQEIQ
ncbi:MAG: hypothetical protein ACREQ7_07675 [Candidatus Binatia bacterium]